ncbi:helix-turn-helix domain-containing protein [Pseudomonas asplenii]|uniref:helix-turn-helix domain-containing protein n=1 Tax=Pseudomonas asplenii TaxID=53407 RepID=UPI0037C5692D
MGYPVFTFSTQALPPRSRFEAWREEVNAIFDINIGKTESSGFNYRLTTSFVGEILMGCGVWEGECAPVHYGVKRPQQMIRRDGLDHYYICLSLSHSIQGSAGRTTLTAGHSQIYVLDLARELDSVIAAGDTIILTVPRDVLSARLGSKDLHGLVLQGALGDLLADHMRALRHRLPDLKHDDIPYVQQATLAMVAAALAPSAANLTDAEVQIDHTLLDRARQLIEQHLHRPDLSPAFVAGQLGLSRARLYRLFAQESGVSAYIQLRRLNKARELLQSDLGNRQRISSLGFQFGFKSDAHFSRSFKTAFGYSPTEAREQAAAGRRRPEEKSNRAHTGFSLQKILDQMQAD